jgi:hypothetical protein
MKSLKFTGAAILSFAIVTGCNPSDQHKEIGGSTDTTSVNKAGGPAIADTLTITSNRQHAKTDSLKGDTTGKGNADPSGSLKKSN